MRTKFISLNKFIMIVYLTIYLMILIMYYSYDSIFNDLSNDTNYVLFFYM